MEECAEIQEWPPKSRPYRLKTLSILARTCSLLSEPALDLLWYRQNTLAHLVRCLPAELRALKMQSGKQELVRNGFMQIKNDYPPATLVLAGSQWEGPIRTGRLGAFRLLRAADTRFHRRIL